MSSPPPGSRIPVNLDEIAAEIYPVREYHVSSWCPARDGKGPATQVHLWMRLPELDRVITLRIKSAEDCDQLIAALERHRNDVWPRARRPKP
jgi:hypothetical protein